MEIKNWNWTSVNAVVSSDKQIFVVDNEVKINGEKLPPCPSAGRNVTIIDGKVYIDGYEWTGDRWKRTVRAIWHMVFS